jgi:hypothetical protein
MRQLAYFVPDIRVAATRHNALYGSGPFFVADNIPLRCSRYRGIDAKLDHSAAYGQFGAVMVEFVQQNNAGHSAFHDMYPEGSGRGGVHHVALFVDDLHAAAADYAAQDCAMALYAEMDSGFAFAMMDTSAQLGHMTELHQPEKRLTDFYAMVAAAELGSGPVLRPISLA